LLCFQCDAARPQDGAAYFVQAISAHFALPEIDAYLRQREA
jgi:hypothetical protein